MPSTVTMIPRGLFDRLRRYLLRHTNTTFFPHADALFSPSLATSDRFKAELESLGAEVIAEFEALIANGALDEAHGDVVDRLTSSKVKLLEDTLLGPDLERRAQLDEIKNQLIETVSRVADEVSVMEADAKRLSAIRLSAWNILNYGNIHAPEGEVDSPSFMPMPDEGLAPEEEDEALVHDTSGDAPNQTDHTAARPEVTWPRAS